MKLVTFIRNGSEKEELGLLRGERVLPLEGHTDGPAFLHEKSGNFSSDA